MSGAPWVKAEMLVAEPMAMPITNPMVKVMGVSILLGLCCSRFSLEGKQGIRSPSLQACKKMLFDRSHR